MQRQYHKQTEALQRQYRKQTEGENKPNSSPRARSNEATSSATEVIFALSKSCSTIYRTTRISQDTARLNLSNNNRIYMTNNYRV